MKMGNREIQYINALESITGANARGCVITPNAVMFMVSADQMKFAIGKDGKNIKRVREKLGVNIDIFEYAERPEDFVVKALKGIKMDNIEVKSGSGEKSMSLGIDAENRKKLMINPGRMKSV
ncbi:NusA-like transcription termination signal-binding factor, partial [Candidatus Micrarchaeota archaeon]|nr:NusA-like transcription termination signal-binding factor [Candidatus Micrarchaeota archaeon]MBU1939629.1 NusA-like transcription termination signal-binding factor [Candidatus Micrarchaeota archaeon]